MERELLCADETASMLNVTRRTLLRWAREKKIGCVRVSRKTILFSREDIESFVEANTHGIESAAVNKAGPSKRMARPIKTKGGDKGASGAMWNDLRKEVQEWE